jgi:hypothetical protein
MLGLLRKPRVDGVFKGDRHCTVRQCLPILFVYGTLNKTLIREPKDHKKVGVIVNPF